MYRQRKIRNTKYQILNTTGKAGMALLMTILILNSIILVSMAAAKLIVSGVKESGTQSRSTKAYFAAEAGAERIIYEYRHGTNNCGKVGYATSTCSFAKNLSSGSSYLAYWKSGYNSLGSTLIFLSVGNYSGLKRTVELDLYY